MALDTLRARLGGRQVGEDEPLEIGSSDARIVNCPVCSRPIVSDARRCSGCGTHLLLGVPVRRAGVLVTAGSLGGILVGIAVVAAVSFAWQTVTAPPRDATGASPGAAPRITISPAAPTAGVAALRQAVAINGRLLSSVDALKASLAAKPFESYAVATVLRSIASDAAVGADAANRLKPWRDADAARAGLAALYAQVRSTARSGLSAALGNTKAYKAAASEMLKVLGTVERGRRRGPRPGRQHRPPAAGRAEPLALSHAPRRGPRPAAAPDRLRPSARPSPPARTPSARRSRVRSPLRHGASR